LQTQWTNLVSPELEWLLECLLRLGCATAIGVAIGFNRNLADKPMGMRTLALVALGAALITLATISFSNLEDHPDALSRVVQGIIQGVLTGIGFIGAGVILRDRQKQTVHGLTTAASVWVTAALGVACGLAEWTVVACGTAITIGVLIVLHWIEKHFGLVD
jgi:putative Mg2+ transporter-C (MgtC) family protein